MSHPTTLQAHPATQDRRITRRGGEASPTSAPFHPRATSMREPLAPTFYCDKHHFTSYAGRSCKPCIAARNRFSERD